MVLGLSSLLSLAVGSLAALVGSDGFRQPALLFFLGVGVGAAPWQVVPGIRGYERLALTFVTGIAVATSVPMLFIGIGYWHPLVSFLLVAAVALPLHLLGLLRIRDEVRADDSPAWPSPWLPLAPTRSSAARHVREGLPATAMAVVGCLACVTAALGHRHLDPGYLGFLTRVGPLWYLGLALVLGALALRGRPEHSKAVPVFLLVVVLTATPALVYDGPRSQSAAKHVDFIQQIQAHGTLDSSVAVYNAYAGFFDAMAWLSSVAGISDPLVLATSWPALLGVFRVVVLRYLAGQFLTTSAQCWVAVTLAVLADAIGADYFSPQSVGFVLGMATIAVAVTRTQAVPRLPVVLIAGATLAVSHQLSPYITGGVLVVLVAFRQLRPWWTPALVVGPALAWSLTHWSAVAGFLTLDAFGRLSNFEPPETTSAPTLERLPVVGHTVWASLLGIGIVTGLAFVAFLQHRREARYWALGFCASVGLVIVALQPYGQEGVFRAALFGIPWLAVMAGPVLAGEALRSRVAVVVASAVLATTFGIASFGLDATNVIRSSDYTAVRQFRAQGGPNPPEPYYMLLLNPGDHPTSPDVVGGRHAIWGRDVIDLPVEEAAGLDPTSEMTSLTAGLVRYTEAPDTEVELYALWSPTGARYGEAYGVRSLEQSAALRDAFASSPYWSISFLQDGTYLFRLDLDAYRAAADG
ncbi:hypothetical protein [Geodermatophilus sp. SYSU D01036]